MYKLVVALTLTALLGGYAANAQTTGTARAPTTSMAPRATSPLQLDLRLAAGAIAKPN